MVKNTLSFYLVKCYNHGKNQHTSNTKPYYTTFIAHSWNILIDIFVANFFINTRFAVTNISFSQLCKLIAMNCPFLVSKRISLLAMSIAIHYFLIASFMLQYRKDITVRNKKCIQLLDYSVIESSSFSCERKWASANKVSRHISFSFRPYLFDQR